MSKPPVIIPLGGLPEREPAGPNLVEKSTWDVARDTRVARMSTTGAHQLTRLAIQYAGEQEREVAAVNPDGAPWLSERCAGYLSAFDAVTLSAYQRLARPYRVSPRKPR